MPKTISSEKNTVSRFFPRSLFSVFFSTCFSETPNVRYTQETGIRVCQVCRKMNVYALLQRTHRRARIVFIRFAAGQLVHSSLSLDTIHIEPHWITRRFFLRNCVFFLFSSLLSENCASGIYIKVGHARAQEFIYEIDKT